MKTSNMKFELILFFDNGWKPRELVKLGYNEGTVYRYKKYYQRSLELFKEGSKRRVDEK